MKPLITYYQAIKDRLYRDFVRIGVFLGLALVLLGGTIDDNRALLYIGGMISLVACFTHVTRRLLFPHTDLDKFAKKSLENPIAAAIVFAAICYVMTALASGGFQLLIGLSR